MSNLEKWQKRLGLQDWRITLKENCKPDDLTVGSGHAGCSVFQEAEKVALVEIVAPENCGESVVPIDTDVTLVHELLHLKFSLLCSVDDPDNDIQSRLVHQLIDDMARALVETERAGLSGNIQWVTPDIAPASTVSSDIFLAGTVNSAEDVEQEQYNQGLNDAWDAVKKLYLDDKNGLSIDEMEKLFGTRSVEHVIASCPIETVVEKIKEVRK